MFDRLWRFCFGSYVVSILILGAALGILFVGANFLLAPITGYWGIPLPDQLYFAKMAIKRMSWVEIFSLTVGYSLLILTAVACVVIGIQKYRE